MIINKSVICPNVLVKTLRSLKRHAKPNQGPNVASNTSTIIVQPSDVGEWGGDVWLFGGLEGDGDGCEYEC